MAYFAQLDGNNNVIQVIVADQTFINSGAIGDPKTWVPCAADGSIGFNYPGPGFVYDPTNQAFVAPQPSIPSNAPNGTTASLNKSFKWVYSTDPSTWSTTTQTTAPS